MSGEWRAHRSLSELCDEAERAIATPSFDVASVERIYDHEFQQHFGKRSRRKSTPKNDLIFSKLVHLCASEGIDPATFISANMRAMRDFVASSPYGFQPNMLSGERARGRYNAFVRHANRRYKRGLGDVAHTDSELGRLRRALASDETSVGELFVRSAWAGSPISWGDAIEMADPGSTWLDFHSQRGGVFGVWEQRLGKPTLQREKRLAELRAAVSVANGFESDLADRIGVATFSWQALADLVVRTYPQQARQVFDFAGIPGGLWR